MKIKLWEKIFVTILLSIILILNLFGKLESWVIPIIILGFLIIISLDKLDERIKKLEEKE